MNRTAATPQRDSQKDFGLLETECGGCAPPVYVVNPGPLSPEGIAPIKPRGSRANKGKPRVALIVPAFLLEMGAVLTMGAEKYAPDNWKKGMPVREIMDSALRHIYAFLGGEDRDAESGKHHLAHAAVNLMFAFWMVANKPEHDDRAGAA